MIEIRLPHSRCSFAMTILVKRRRYEQDKALTSILVNAELNDKNKARYKQDKASADFSTRDLLLVNEREKTQA